MIYLSNAALNYAIKICKEKEKYHVGIILDKYCLKNSIYEKLKESIITSDNILKIYNTRYKCGIFFNNGSQIKIIDSNNNYIGYYFHLLIVDENIDYKIINDKLIQCEKKYLHKKI